MDEEMFNVHAKLERSHWWFLGRRQVLHTLLDALAPAGQGIVLDLGCATGGLTASLAPRYQCVGVDPFAGAIELARELYPECKFEVSSASDALAQYSSNASIYLLLDILEHISEDADFLDEVIASSARGQVIVITVPADMRLWSVHDETAGHLRRYDKEQFASLWQDQPVRVRLLSYYNSRLYGVVLAIRSVMRVLRISMGRGGSDFFQPPSSINKLLAGIFAGEAKTLLRAIDGAGQPYSRGVSLIAALEKL